MIAPVLGAAWVVVVVAAFLRASRRRPPRRVDQLRPTPPLGRRAGRHGDRLRRAIRVAAAAVVPLPLAPMPVGLVLAVASGATVASWPRLERARRSRRRIERLRNEVPEIVDLLALGVGAGLNVGLAVDAVARRAGGELATELGSAIASTRQGHRLADALDDVAHRAGEPVRPLVAALVASERYGAPLLPGLERLAAEVRADRRRRADEAARRVSVKLLFPLVLCVLPAFALLTVAPLIASALRSLRL